MNYGSVCSGIEAASMAWKPLGWHPAFVSEIDAFPCELLSVRHPDAPNWGDMTKFHEWPDTTIDVLVGGTPCQSFSVAGLRKGLDDPRGNLMLTYLAIAARYRPRWLVWENVPGVLSDKTDAITQFLDGLEELGYVVDIDILDAQWFGLAQRRERVFVCAQSVESLINQQTDSSALTIAQCWQEMLHGILVSASIALGREPDGLESPYLTKDGVKRRMKLFGMLGESGSYPILRANLVAAFRRYHEDQSNLVAPLGEKEKARILAGPLTDSLAVSRYTLTEQSLVSALDESYAVMKSFITSIGTSSTTTSTIYSCSRAVLLIAKLTQVLNHSSPPFWNAASSSLNALEEYIDFATFTSSDLFGDVERVSDWRDFLREAEPTSESLGDIAVGCFGEVLPVSQSMHWNLAPDRQARTDVAASLTAGSHPGSNAPGRRREDDVNLVSHTLMGKPNDSQDAASMQTYIASTLRAESGRNQVESTYVTHALTAEGFDASEDGTGRGTHLTVAFNARQDPDSWVERTGPLDTDGSTQAIAFNLRGREGGSQAEVTDVASIRAASGGSSRSYVAAIHENQRGEITTNDTAGTINSGGGKPGQGYPAVQSGMAVRRLTPRECERLQGFPDDYTLIEYKGKPATDGVRYKGLGNSMAVPVMAWIGKRIAMYTSQREADGN